MSRFIPILALLALTACTADTRYVPSEVPCDSAASCPLAHACVDRVCVAEDPCEGNECPDACDACDPWQVCDGGICYDADPCFGVTCNHNEQCIEGSCFLAEDSCDTQHITCPAGHSCVLGVCRVDLCTGVRCGEGRVCAEGSCVIAQDCDGHNCRPCLSDEMCDLGQICRRRGNLSGPRYCREDADGSRLGLACSNDDGCGDDVCVGGTCAPRCDTSADCARTQVCELAEGDRLRACVHRHQTACRGGCDEGYCSGGACVQTCTTGEDCGGDCGVEGIHNAFDGNACVAGEPLCPDHTLRVLNEPELFCLTDTHCSLDAHCTNGTTCMDATELGASQPAHLGVCGLRLR